MILRHDETRAPQWHLLQISDVLDEEMGAALASSVPVLGWKPERTLLPWGHAATSRGMATNQNLPFPVQSLPLMRGYARPPWSKMLRTGQVVSRLLQSHRVSQDDVLLCTVPFFAPVAELWPGPVVYWLTDLIAEYESARGLDVVALDERMGRAATLICPNSARLGEYLHTRARCPAEKIVVLPNATREANVLSRPSAAPDALPHEAKHRDRPVVGVIGNLAGNLDWVLLEQAMRHAPDFTWLFVGPVNMAVADAGQSAARSNVQSLPNACFVGSKPYGELYRYARAFDVAVLPYRRCEPTYSGSSTRFYEHLAAGRPMIATRGFEELLHKEPLLYLVDTAAEMVKKLNHLRERNFEDGVGEARWLASRDGTWQARASVMQSQLGARIRQPVAAR